MADEEVREMITAEQVMARISVTRASLHRMEKDGHFPKGHLISPHKKFWFKDEVVAWQKKFQSNPPPSSNEPDSPPTRDDR